MCQFEQLSNTFYLNFNIAGFHQYKVMFPIATIAVISGLRSVQVKSTSLTGHVSTAFDKI